MINKSIFTTRFKQLCKLKKKTQAEIAESLGISVNGLKHYMRKTNNTFPPVEYLDLMAKEFDVDVAYLIGEIDVPKHSMLTLTDATGLDAREFSMKRYSDLAKDWGHKEIEKGINDYLDKTYAIDLIARNSKYYSSDFCNLMDLMADSDKIYELSSLVKTLFGPFPEKSIVTVRTETSYPFNNTSKYAFKTEVANKKILKNRIISLFSEIIDDKITYSFYNDPDTAKDIAMQLINFVENNFFEFPRKRLVKYIIHYLEEIKEINDFAYILRFSPSEILSDDIFKIANYYNYTFSQEFKDKYIQNTKSFKYNYLL